jgi:hypothetical protein
MQRPIVGLKDFVDELLDLCLPLPTLGLPMVAYHSQVEPIVRPADETGLFWVLHIHVLEGQLVVIEGHVARPKHAFLPLVHQFMLFFFLL